MNEYDVLVVGGGAAGLSAALVLSRARRRVAVVDDGRPRNAPASHMHGYLSRDGLPPAELLSLGREEVVGYGADLITGTVTTLGRGFRATLDDGTSILARRVLVTTGLRDQIPDIPGLAERWGRDVLHCPYCHGYEVRDRALGVLGGDQDAIAYALLIRQWSNDVILFTRGQPPTPEQHEALRARAVGVESRPVRRVSVVEDALRGVELEDGQVIPRSALFVRPTLAPNDAILRGLGCERDERGWTAHDADGATSVAGLYVAGNASDPRAQVITAAGQGSAAAIAINNDLVADDARASVDRLRDRPRR
ncbi:NAD(P)/FAD-dependent oxidoreductase [Agromyces protaetiae]|uniref:NAD(P)/FAD-dependent oxidoreductase n=1 Tax=Agromyces protaetiae TaxID=2509455 RepID=A0A4P6FCS0_9MICO|nr:NAD(P)/FAD-dependent oxidoreductase [Agromyces protaetiae]QAY73684.1 NAD(P)/FAD-dependent oxidoreductase [Agromyces protaetiae]